MMLSELELIKELLENYYDTKYQLADEARKLVKAREIIQREIKLKEMDPRK